MLHIERDLADGELGQPVAQEAGPELGHRVVDLGGVQAEVPLVVDLEVAPAIDRPHHAMRMEISSISTKQYPDRSRFFIRYVERGLSVTRWHRRLGICLPDHVSWFPSCDSIGIP